jgi:hypothetical protein
MSTMNDPFDAASEATLAPRSYYGQIQIDAYFCVLQKGVGKRHYDPGQHRAEDRRTAIDISLLPIAEQNITFELRREVIAESREWAGIIWPSLKALGLTNTRDANGKWAKMQQVPSGRTYRTKSGEEREATTFKFLALYDSEDACRAAYLADTGQDAGGANNGAPTAAAPSNGNGSNSSHALDVAKPFIIAFAKQHHYDLEKTKAACANQTIITQAIDLDSPEFAQIVAEAMAAEVA